MEHLISISLIINCLVVFHLFKRIERLEKPKTISFDKFQKLKTRKKKEKGCTEPLYGKKSKCVINIVPQEEKSATFQMDKKCIKTRE